jgi:hypothetical protein
MSLRTLQNPRVDGALTPPGAADHHCAMKSFLSVLALCAALGLAAGCGPQNAFCPNTSAKDAGGVCPINGDDVMVQVMDMASGCPVGQYLGDDPNGSGSQVCLCSVGGTLPPCN